MPGRNHTDDANWDKLVGAIYDCAVDPAGWPQVLCTLERLTNARAGVLHCLDQRPQASKQGSVLVEHNTDPCWSAKYRDQYAALNPERDRIGHLPLYQPYTNSDLFGWTNFTKSAYHNEYRVPQDFGDSLNLLLDRTANRSVSLSLFRPAKDPLYGTDDLRILKRLAPHLQRSAKIAGLLAQGSRHSDTLTEVLEHLKLGVVALDRDLRIVHINSAAQGWSQEHLFFTQPDGSMGFANAQDAGWLRRQLRGLDSAERRRLFQTASGKPAVLTTWLLGDAAVTPQIFRAMRSAACLLVIQAADDETPGGCDLFAIAFGLTPGEQRVMRSLMAGQTLNQSAQHLGLTLSTVKTHLHRIFLKTGANRQSELMRKAVSFGGTLG